MEAETPCQHTIDHCERSLVALLRRFIAFSVTFTMDIGYTKIFEQQEDSRMSGNKRSVHMEDLHDDNDHPVFPKTPFSKKMRTNDGTPGTVASYEDNVSVALLCTTER